MEPVSIGLLVAYIIIIAIALERSYRVHSLKLKCAVSDKNTEDLEHEHRAFIITTLRKYGVRMGGYGGTWCVCRVFNKGGGPTDDYVFYNDLVLLDDGKFYFNLNVIDGVLKTSCASIPYAGISEQALAVLCKRFADTYNNWVKTLCKNKASKGKVPVKPVKCKIKKRKSPTEVVADSPEGTTPKAPAKKKTPKYKAEKVSTKPVKVKIKK
jgi:hypothetical protein